jgi:hypothetical protein
MKVKALEECFASNAIRRVGDEFEFTPIDDIIPHFLIPVDTSNDDPAPENDIYAALSDAQIRRRLEDCCVKVPPLADREAIVVMLAAVEGKELKQEVPTNKPKRGEKKNGKAL